MRTAQAVCQRFWGAAAAASGVLYLWVAVPVKTHDVFPWERRVAEVVAVWQRPWFDALMSALAWAGQATVVIPVAVAVAFVNRRRWGDLAWFSAFIVAASPLVSKALGWWVARPRPSGIGNGFPSVHSLLATTVLGLAVVVLWRPTSSTFVRAGVLVLGAALLVAIAISLVYLGLYWPADVVGGVVAGVAYFSSGMWVLLRVRSTTCPES
jgi:undecaprenyl-diphosphatase